MLEHQQTTEENPAHLLPQTQTPCVGLPPQAHAVLIGYLAQTQQADADTETMRARLEELTLAYLELDSSPHEAAKSSIQQWENERRVLEEGQALATQSNHHIAFLHRRNKPNHLFADDVPAVRPARLAGNSSRNARPTAARSGNILRHNPADSHCCVHHRTDYGHLHSLSLRGLDVGYGHWAVLAADWLPDSCTDRMGT